RAGLRSRGALGGRLPPGAVACGHCCWSGEAWLPRRSVPRSADMVPVSLLLASRRVMTVSALHTALRTVYGLTNLSRVEIPLCSVLGSPSNEGHICVPPG